MKALVRTLLAVIGVLALLVVGAVVYITTFFDPNDLKPRLVEAVRSQTGLELQLEGPLSWSFYPRIGVSVEQAEAWLPDQPLEEAPFAAFDSAAVSMAFAPLLSGEVAVDGLTLDGMRLNLERDEQGRGNWEALLEHMEGRGEEAEDVLAPASAGPGLGNDADSLPVALDIASVQVRDSRVNYVDRQLGLDLTFTDLTVEGTNVNPERAFPLALSFDVTSAEPNLNSHVDFASRVRLGLSNGRYTFDNVTLDSQTVMPELSDQPQGLNFQADSLVADTGEQLYSLDGARFDASVTHPQIQQPPLALTLSFAGNADLAEQTAQLRDVLLSGADNLRLSGSVSFTDLLETPQYSGQVKLAPMSLRAWLARFGVAVDTGSDTALTDLALTSPLRGDLTQATLTNLSLLLDGSTFTGRLGAGFGGQSLAFDLQGERLDLDAYLPSSDAEGESADTAAIVPAVPSAYAAEEEAEALLPIELLQTLTLEGKLALEQLKVKGLTLSDVALTASGADGRHRIDKLDAKLYDGTLAATASVDVRQEPVRLAFSEQLREVDIAPLYQDATGEASPLRGRLTLEGEFTSRTNTLDTLVRNLNGNASLRIDDGAMLDVNVSREMCTTVAMLEGRESTREWSEDTAFDQIAASVRVVNGVAQNDDLTIRIPGIELTGEGSVNLVTERLDYDAFARFIDTADEEACKVNPRLERVRVPVHCEGNLNEAPGQWCAFDRQAFQNVLTELARDEASRKASERVDRELDKRLGGDTAKKIDERLGEGTTEELRNTLRGLFN
ncbi:AsmA family protein [Halomonas shantousis]